jgi:hypothetical protein
MIAAMFSGIAILCGPVPQAQQLAKAPPSTAADASADLATMPPLPQGRTTIFGGDIRSIDPIRDELTLNVYGQRPMRILFDERTEVYRDGKRVALRDLTAVKHASVETTLDGSKIFAVSIHALSEAPVGTYEGRILSYSSSTGQLVVSSGLMTDQLKVLVQRDTSILRKGQSVFASASTGASDLENGSLVSVQFEGAKGGQAVASRIEILAVPGSEFVFSGNVSWIDFNSGLLVLTDPRDQKEHEIFFTPSRVPDIRDAHLGTGVRVVATYDGIHYVASGISVIKP